MEIIGNKEKQIKVLDKIHARKRAQKQTEKYEQAHYDACIKVAQVQNQLDNKNNELQALQGQLHFTFPFMIDPADINVVNQKPGINPPLLESIKLKI